MVPSLGADILLRLVLVCLSVALAVRADPHNPIYGPFETFRTEPTFEAHSVNVSVATSNPALLSPGFYFIAPKTLFERFFGPHIIDHHGQFVWYGKSDTVGDTMDFYVCNYGDRKHDGRNLCISQAHTRGTEMLDSFTVVADDTYTQISPEITHDPDYPENLPGEGHEFNMLDSGTSYITAVRQLEQYDLSAYHGPETGTVANACWQHIDMPSYRQQPPLFTWCALDPGHLNIWDTEVYLNLPTTVEAGNYTDGAGGLGNAERPWDLFHQNSIDPDHDGNYLVSLRHSDQIILVAGPNTTRTDVQPGDIVWRLGGFRHNDFAMAGGWTFSRQHHVRYVASNKTHLTFTLFNNGWTQRTSPSAEGGYSSGQIITVDNSSMTAHLVREYRHPFASAANVSVAQGATQLLPNGNVVVGWGSVPELTEFTEDGQVLWHARFAGMEGFELLSYRAHKYPWVGRPTYPPKLLAYRKSCSDTDEAPLFLYTSWNGATEVTSWHFWVRSGWPGLWIYAGHTARSGFETQAELSNLDGPGWSIRLLSAWLQPHWEEVYVRGADARGHTLGSTTAVTFVPRSGMEQRCDDQGCACVAGITDDQGCTGTGNFIYAPKWSVGLNECGSKSASVAMAAVLAALAMLFFVASAWLVTRLRRRGGWGHIRTILQNAAELDYYPRDKEGKGNRSWLDPRQLFTKRREQEHSSVPLLEYDHREQGD